VGIFHCPNHGWPGPANLPTQNIENPILTIIKLHSISSSLASSAITMITEIAIFELAASADLSDATSPTTSTIRDFLASVTAAKGAHSAYFGQFIEKPETVIMFIDWDSAAAHKQFVATV
jgi:hypothetical protein